MRAAAFVAGGFPAPAGLADYEAAAAEIEDRLERIPGAVAVYRTGAVSAPGVSDLDHVLVVEDGARVADIWMTLTPRTRALAMHTPFAVERTTFVRHRRFAHLDPLYLVTGDEVAVDPAPADGGDLLAVEALVVTLLRLVKAGTTGFVKPRSLLCELHSLRHDLELARLGPEVGEAWELVLRVGEMRRRATEGDHPQHDEIRALLAGGIAAVGAMLDALAARQEPSAGVVLELARPWQNVRLSPHAPRPPMPARSLPARFRRVSEVRWRLRGRAVRVPAAVTEMIVNADPERKALVRAHRAFVEGRAPGYSMLGFASAFVPEERP